MPRAKKDDMPAKMPKEASKRTRISQSDVPAHKLSDALRISAAIVENYGSAPTKPLDVAVALDISPTSSLFKMLTGASIAYGLTDGGYNAAEISLTELAKTIHSPLEEGADHAAKVEAFLKPRIVRDFVEKYDGSPIPRDDIAQNVLSSMGVPSERSEATLEMIMSGAQSLGLLSEIKGKRYVNLSNRSKPMEATESLSFQAAQEETDEDSVVDVAPTNARENPGEAASQDKLRKVFITHGKNRGFVEPIKKLLAFGELEAVVSVEKQSVSQPVPDKVMNDMRACGAAIIHVESEMKLLDADANEHVMLNPNVLIEIGAAMALFGRRFILLVKQGVTLPSNLQGLYEVRYNSETLDGDATIRLLEAIKQLKETPSV
ncbi:MAG: TIR domain-containing protein [Pseudomonadota bacterium]